MTAPLSEWEREAQERLERSQARRKPRRDNHWPLALFTLIILLALAIVVLLNQIQGLH